MMQLRRKYYIICSVLLAILLVPLSGSGIISLKWGIVPFFGGSALITVSLLWLSSFIFSKEMNSGYIVRVFRYILTAGLITSFSGLLLLSGSYIRYVAMDRLSSRWILFWPLVLVACLIFIVGMYRKIIQGNIETFKRWERFIKREDREPRSFLKNLWEEVILQKQLRRESHIRWLRHVLIFWGFVSLWLVDFAFAVITKYLPIFGWPSLSKDSAVRVGFDFFLDFFGLMILTGTAVALLWGLRVRRTTQKIYTDTPTAAFLFIVAFTGYLVEGLRLAALPYEPYMGYSFLGNFVASFIRGTDLSFSSIHRGLWLFHVVISCAFIAYFPVKRLVHSCATPVGKLMQSQKKMLDKKVKGVVSGLLNPEE